MNVMFYEDPAAYAREYQEVRGAFISQGTSLQAWLDANGIDRQLAYRALKGRSFGKKAVETRRAVLREVSRLRASV